MGQVNNAGGVMYRNHSRLIQAARKAGIKIDLTRPHLPETEQEQADTM